MQVDGHLEGIRGTYLTRASEVQNSQGLGCEGVLVCCEMSVNDHDSNRVREKGVSKRYSGC